MERLGNPPGCSPGAGVDFLGVTAGNVVRIGVLGCGNVGAAFVMLVTRQAEGIEQRTGLRLEV